MECDVCGQSPSTKRPFHCTTCARSAIYPHRIEHAAILMDKEVMGQKLETVIASDGRAPRQNVSLSGAIIDTAECSKTHHLEEMQSETILLNDRADLIAEKAKELREEMEELRKKIAQEKKDISQRKSDHESASYEIDDRSAKELESVRAVTKRIHRKWEVQHQEIMKCKFWLCKDAAMLADLRLGKKGENGKRRDNVLIGPGVPIFDLRELNTAQPDTLTASLTHIAFLLHRTSTYLGIRLPAEITLPHRDYPLPTIFKPDQSYRSRDVPFPGQTPSHSSVNSPTASRILDNRPTPRPRPLFAQKELTKLVKEDPTSFSLFTEGVTLLAWNIAWLCKCQGMGGFTSWTDVCPMGRNLYLLFDPESRRARKERQSARSNNAEALKESGTSADRSAPSSFGKLSHGTAHSFLGAAEASEIVSNWRLQNPQRVWDRVKQHLLSELQKAEWEVVQQWDDEEDLAEEEPVLVGGRKWTLTAGRSVVPNSKASSDTAQPARSTPAEDGNASVKSKGPPVNGWTKVRSRSTGEQQ